ncbi:beta-glucosidase 13-like [Quercus robur]|uniref:beta-glucosidase 13-like n=1 Tax=Quercus robur TaxID=38942 RepID=UPI002161FC1F|nr:beta-glucosidase 13-like [Quercus robur]
MALLDHVSLRRVSCPQSFHFTSENNVFVTLPVRVPSFRKGYHHSTVKCLKGEIKLPTPLKDKQNGHDCKPSTISGPQVVKRKDFPFDFMFGASTSALQTEGAGDEGGRGPSTWDRFIQDGVGERDIAVDSYNRYKEDVQLLKKMGVDAYRFSIAWPRILPKGTVSGGVNQEGIDFYNNFINELLQNGITPFVTLFHFDLPQALQDEYDGFLNRRIVDDFKNYSDLCFQTFGDRVKHWTTINEPQVFGQYGYKMGSSNPNPNPATDPYLATHHIILAHAAAAKLYKEKYQATQGGEIGISLVCQWFEPETRYHYDKDAADRAVDFLMGWYMDPLVYGDYPFVMKALVRNALPKFSEEEKELVKGAYDFIGVNYYTSRYASTLPIDADDSPQSHDQYQYVDLKVDRNGKPIGELAEGSDAIYIYPEGLKEILVHLKKDYQNPKIYITENGVPSKRDDTIPVEKALEDDYRIEHILGHLYAVREGMKKGANVKGFFIWALMDNMEMGSGYNVRFGLNYVDYLDNLNRHPKKSAKWLRSFLKE